MGLLPLWAWVLFLFAAGVAYFSTVMYSSETNRRENVEFVWKASGFVLIAMLVAPFFWGFASAVVDDWDRPHQYGLPDCPGAGVSYHEEVVRGNGGAPNLVEQYQAAGWSNMTSEVRGDRGFWASEYTVVTAHCPGGERA